jgi:hypothetical protein
MLAKKLQTANLRRVATLAKTNPAPNEQLSKTLGYGLAECLRGVDARVCITHQFESHLPSSRSHSPFAHPSPLPLKIKSQTDQPLLSLVER